MKKYIFIILLIFTSISFLYSSETDSLLNIINRSKDQLFVSKQLHKLNELYLLNNDTNASFSSKRELNAAISTKNEFQIAEAYHSIGLALKLSGDGYNSTEFLRKEIALREKIKDEYGLAAALNSLGESYRSIFDFEKAFDYLRHALNIYNKLSDNYGIAKTLNRIAAVYAEKNDTINRLKSIEYAVKSNEIAFKFNDTDLIVSNFLIIGVGYTTLQKFELALENLNKSLQLIDNAKEKFHNSLILKALGTNYLILKDYEKAIYYGKLAYFDAIKTKTNVYIWLSTELLFMSYESIKQLDSMYKYQAICYMYKRKIMSEDKERDLNKLESKYQSEKYERELEYKNTQNKYLFIIYLLITGVILSVLSFIIIRYKSQKKINSELNLKNQLIEVQKNELTELNITKDKFFSLIAHDLINPISSINQSVELYYNDYNELTEKEKLEFLGLLKNTTKNVFELLSNLLTWSRSQRGLIEYHPIELDISLIVKESTELLLPLALKKNIQIDNKLSTKLLIFADVNMMFTIIRNLLSNAIKFTSQNGTITIGYIQKQLELIVFVKDNGIGMNTKIMEKLFSLDKNTSTLGTAKEKGTGLGLILCKEFADKNNARIWAESEFGKGSTFFISLPTIKANS